MSKPSRRPNRENRSKKKRDRELKRQIEELPVVVTFYDDKGSEYEYEYEFDLDCDACWARRRGDDKTGSRPPGRWTLCR